MAYAMSTDFLSVPHAMLDLAQRCFSGWLQSRINEKANKVLREAESKDNCSKVGAGNSVMMHGVAWQMAHGICSLAWHVMNCIARRSGGAWRDL